MTTTATLDQLKGIFSDTDVVGKIVLSALGSASLRQFTQTYAEALGYRSPEAFRKGIEYFCRKVEPTRAYSGEQRATKRTEVLNFVGRVRSMTNAEIAGVLRKLASEFECGTHGPTGNHTDG